MLTMLTHGQFEESVYAAFPVLPIPEHQQGWGQTTCFQREAWQRLRGRPWPEVIGWRLHEGEVDLTLSIWFKSLPLEVSCYYLPSHLMLASIILRGGESNYVYGVVEALILPPSNEAAELDELDDELGNEATVAWFASSRLAMYQALTEAQRRCVAEFLDLYLDRNRTSLTRRGTDLFLQNIVFWRDSSLPDTASD